MLIYVLLLNVVVCLRPWFFTFLLFTIMAMSGPSTDAFAENFELFVSFAGGGQLEDRVASLGFKRLPIVYQRSIDLNHDGWLDIEQYKEHVDNRFRFYAGPVALDWEGKATRPFRLRNKPKEQIENLVDEFLVAVKILQNVSPTHLEIGFFGFPSWKARRFNSLYRMQGEVSKMQKIYDKVEILYPELYLRNSYSSSFISISFAQNYLRNMLTIACEQETNKKVYVFISHRWSPGSLFDANCLIPLDVFGYYIKIIREVNYKKCKVNGIVWWGADERWYKKWKRKEIINSIDSYGSFMNYNDEVINNYADTILKNSAN